MSTNDVTNLQLAPLHLRPADPLRISELEKSILSAKEMAQGLELVIIKATAATFPLSSPLVRSLKSLRMQCLSFAREGSRVSQGADISELASTWSEDFLETALEIQLSYHEVSAKLVEELRNNATL